MEREYIIAFSSFYKAAYAQDMLEEVRIGSSLRKLPTELVRSCSTGLYLRTDSIQAALDIFEKKQIVPVGVYEIRRQGRGKRSYQKVRQED